MIKLSQLKRATKIYNQIQDLEKEIKTITKHAEILANKEAEVCFHSEIIQHEEEETQQVAFDEDGSLMQGGGQDMMQMVISGMMGAGMPMPVKRTKQIKPLHLHFNNKEGLLLLAAIIKIKMDHKDVLFAKLQKCNVSI